MRKGILFIIIIILLGFINMSMTKRAIDECSKYNDINFCKETLK